MLKTKMINPEKPVITNLAGEFIEVDIPDRDTVPANLNLTRTTVKVEQMTKSIALKLNLGSYVDSSAEGSDTFYLMQIAFSDPNFWLREYNNQEVAVIYGSSLRIGITITEGNAKASANLGIIAANANYKKVSATLKQHTTGMHTDLSTAINKALPSGESFNMESIASIGKAVSEMQSMIRLNPDLLMPARLEMTVMPSQADSDYLQGVTTAYALHCITNDRDYTAAAQRLKNKVANGNTSYYYQLVNTALLKGTYQQVLEANYDSALTSQAKKTAHKIYDNTKA